MKLLDEIIGLFKAFYENIVLLTDIFTLPNPC